MQRVDEHSSFDVPDRSNRVGHDMSRASVSGVVTPSAISWKIVLSMSDLMLARIAAPAALVDHQGRALAINESMRAWLRKRREPARRFRQILALMDEDPRLVRHTIAVDPGHDWSFVVLEPVNEEETYLVERASEQWSLTHRQREVLTLVVEGFSNVAIALRLGVRENTIEVHVSALFRRSGAASRVELVRGVLYGGRVNTRRDRSPR